MGEGICALLGVAWQFARARKGVSEWWTVAAFGIAVALCSWLWSDWTFEPEHGRASVRAFLAICGSNLTAIAAANQGTSVAARLLSKLLPAKPGVIPVTDSN